MVKLNKNKIYLYFILKKVIKKLKNNNNLFYS